MTQPGPMDWATNDVWAAGPDAGDDTKLEPTAGQIGEGYYTGRRPSPQIRNWLDHRAGLLRRAVARSMLLNPRTDWDTSLVAAAGMVAATAFDHAHAYDQVNGEHWLFFIDNAGGPPYGIESHARAYERWSATGNANQNNGPVNRLDADGSHDGKIIFSSQLAGGGGHLRYHDFAGGGWQVPATPPAVGLNWGAICCDRDTYGNGYSHWMVGDRPGGGASTIEEAVDALPANCNFANNAAYNALALAQDIDGIFHSRHPALALGPSDPGNPVWLVLTPTSVVRSADDGASWTVAAHGFAGNFSPGSMAYSRTSQRWVLAIGNAAGDVAYSDDNGATWTTIGGALAAAANTYDVYCDGYGAFYAHQRRGLTLPFHVSVDEGLTWTEFDVESTAGFQPLILGSSIDSSKNIDDTPSFPELFLAMHYDAAAGGMIVWHTNAG